MARVRNRAARRSRSSSSVALGPDDPRIRRNNQSGVTDDDLDQETIILNSDDRLEAVITVPTKIKTSALATVSQLPSGASLADTVAKVQELRNLVETMRLALIDVLERFKE